YIADYIVVAFGVPGVYGMFSKLYATGSGINHYLEGYLPSENMRIREEKITFKLHEIRNEATYIEKTEIPLFEWNNVKKKLNGFELFVESGCSYRGEVIGIVGPNAIGKTTFIKILAGIIEPDEGYVTSTVFTISYKPQYLVREVKDCSIVEECLSKVNKEALNPDNWLFHEVIRRLGIDRLFKKEVRNLSGGELQKFYIAASLIKDADIYLLDEPSAHIDVEDQLAVARAIKRVTRLRKATTFVVEHNLLLIDYAVDRLMVFTGTPEKQGHGLAPAAVPRALNNFLRDLGITFRRDPKTGRPRMNKPGSYLDRYQRSIGEYFYTKPIETEE
ncbi:MAG TPA: ATP-binding cassette domain-containing protein, partial [Ignisphaera sp.]|nr:ATP-binding cassette domain-containing protein [Ignisphaera sp.]